MEWTKKEKHITNKGFEPFFYVVPDHWKKKEAIHFKQWIKMQLDDRFENCVTFCKIREGKKLYGFDNFKNYKFLQIGFKNQTVFNKVKKLWYHDNKDFKKRRLKKKGLEFEKYVFVKLYEGGLPLLRYFHIQDISPSGWATFTRAIKKVKLPYKKLIVNMNMKQNDNIVPIQEKENLLQ